MLSVVTIIRAMRFFLNPQKPCLLSYQKRRKTKACQKLFTNKPEQPLLDRRGFFIFSKNRGNTMIKANS